MELCEQVQGSVRVLKVDGRIDQATAASFQDELTPRINQCTSEGMAVVLDFSGVEYISSVGLRVLMLAARQVKSQQGRIAIAALTPVVAEVFQISRFNLVFPVHRDVAAAIASLS